MNTCLDLLLPAIKLKKTYFLSKSTQLPQPKWKYEESRRHIATTHQHTTTHVTSLFLTPLAPSYAKDHELP